MSRKIWQFLKKHSDLHVVYSISHNPLSNALRRSQLRRVGSNGWGEPLLQVFQIVWRLWCEECTACIIKQTPFIFPRSAIWNRNGTVIALAVFVGKSRIHVQSRMVALDTVRPIMMISVSCLRFLQHLIAWLIPQAAHFGRTLTSWHATHWKISTNVTATGESEKQLW